MNNITRFTNRANNYARFRPGYPAAIIDHLTSAIGLHSAMDVADIGSGTGISSVLFLDNGHTVYGVEPNDAMRAEAEKYLHGYDRFHSINGTAENTSLPDNSIDIILAGQSFHWFAQQEAKQEFRRIARPDAHILLLWNIRDISTDFSTAYERIIARFGRGYEARNRDLAAEDKHTSFFSSSGYCRQIFTHTQLLDYEQLRGRLLSTSFLPSEEDADCAAMLAELAALFNFYEENGKIRFDYTTTLYTAKID